MLGPRRVHAIKDEAARRDKLLEKLLARVNSEFKRRGMSASKAELQEARSLLESSWDSHNGTAFSEAEIRSLVAQLVGRSQSSAAVSQPKPSSSENLQQQAAPRPATPETVAIPATESPEQSIQRTKQLLMSTTRRERSMLADHKWIDAARNDREFHSRKVVEEKQEHLNHLAKQRQLFDEQIAEHNRQKELEAEAARQRQREMDAAIENHRLLSRKEREEAFNKAMREKLFREQQHHEREEARERARQKEHDDQVRHNALVAQELENQREAERQRKAQERNEWKKTLQENFERLEWKKHEKERTRAEDRLFQKLYTDQLDKVERERAEQKARKAARAKHFGGLAERVSSMFMAKQQDLSDKIEAEYQAQLRIALEDEAFRKARNKQNTAEAMETCLAQAAEKKRLAEEARLQAKRDAEERAEQIRLANQQEAARRQAARLEARRLNEFLNTQVQLAHYKETCELETSIARPESRAKTMLSPSRYTPSPVADELAHEIVSKGSVIGKAPPRGRQGVA